MKFVQAVLCVFAVAAAAATDDNALPGSQQDPAATTPPSGSAVTTNASKKPSGKRDLRMENSTKIEYMSEASETIQTPKLVSVNECPPQIPCPERTSIYDLAVSQLLEEYGSYENIGNQLKFIGEKINRFAEVFLQTAIKEKYEMEITRSEYSRGMDRYDSNLNHGQYVRPVGPESAEAWRKSASYLSSGVQVGLPNSGVQNLEPKVMMPEGVKPYIPCPACYQNIGQRPAPVVNQPPNYYNLNEGVNQSYKPLRLRVGSENKNYEVHNSRSINPYSTPQMNN